MISSGGIDGDSGFAGGGGVGNLVDAGGAIGPLCAWVGIAIAMSSIAVAHKTFRWIETQFIGSATTI
jgi:hypothetical protein